MVTIGQVVFESRLLMQNITNGHIGQVVFEGRLLNRHHQYIKNGHIGLVIFEGRLLMQTSPVHKEWSYKVGDL